MSLAYDDSINDVKLAYLEPDRIEDAIDQTKRFNKEIQSLLSASSTGWIMGTTNPTALDAHVVILLARLHDIKRENLIPEALVAYGKAAMEQPAFPEALQGPSTIPPGV